MSTVLLLHSESCCFSVWGELSGLSREQIIDQRYAKFRNMGNFFRRGGACPLNKTGVIIAVFVVAIAILIAFSTFHGKNYRVAVCMNYAGQTACRTVSGKSEEGSLRSAISNACGEIASGVTATMGCEATPPA